MTKIKKEGVLASTWKCKEDPNARGRRGEEIVAYVAFVAVTRESFYADDFEEGEG